MKKYSLVLLLLISAVPSMGQNNPDGSSQNLDSGTALHGYDPVSYFSGMPAEGSLEHSVLHNNATYLFQSAENRETFIRNPDKYTPGFGGWCAYAMGATGELVDVDPETFKIVDGKLYLFYNAYFNNTLKKWNKNEAELLPKAVKNWEHIIK